MQLDNGISCLSVLENRQLFQILRGRSGVTPSPIITEQVEITSNHDLLELLKSPPFLATNFFIFFHFLFFLLATENTPTIVSWATFDAHEATFEEPGRPSHTTYKVVYGLIT